MRIPLVCAFLFEFYMERYSVIENKQKREIALLIGRGCAYKKCTFCDYHTDCSDNISENFKLNKSVLDKVTGKYNEIEIINSGSVFELDRFTTEYIKKICKNKKIDIIHFESHYLYRDKIPELRENFYPVKLKMKLGLETFDFDFRESVLDKGINCREPESIAENFDEANFLVGVKGQSLDGIKHDIETGLKYFQRICINVFNENSTPIKPDNRLIDEFIQQLYPLYKDNSRVDILISNLDFGVGA